MARSYQSIDRRSPLKEKPLRGPGASVQDRVVDQVFARMLAPLWVASLLWILLANAVVQDLTHWHPPTKVYLSLAVVGTLVCSLVFWRAIGDVDALRLGRDGERTVGHLLEHAFLPLGGLVLHDVPGKGFNLDHVLITRQGVFVIETKTRSKGAKDEISLHEDGLRIAGYPPDRDPLVQVEAGARWLAEWLQRHTRKHYPVKGVLVFPGWWVQKMSGEWLRSGRPWVLSPKALPSFVGHEPTRLTTAKVHFAAEALRSYMGIQLEAMERT